MVALDDLAPIFQLTVREDTIAGGVSVGYKNKTVVLTPGQPVASAGGRLVSLPAPLTRDGRRWLVPVDFLPRALAVIYDSRLERPQELAPGARRRRAGAAHHRPPGIELGPGSRHPRRLAAHAPHDRPGAEPPPRPLRIRRPRRRRCRPSHRRACCRPSAWPTRRRRSRWTSARASTSYRASAVPQDAASSADHHRPGGVAADPANPSFPRPVTPPPPVVPNCRRPASRQRPALRTIVIDAGHGGDETGARGPARHGREGRRRWRSRGGSRRPSRRASACACCSRATATRRSRSTTARRSPTTTRPTSSSASTPTPRLRQDASGARDLLPEPRRVRRRGAPASRPRGSRCPALGGGTRDIEMILVGDGAGPPPQRLGGAGRRPRGAVARPRPAERARRAAGAVPRARRRQHAGGARRGRLPHATPTRSSSCSRTRTRATLVQALLDGILRFRELPTERARPDAAGADARGPPMTAGRVAAWTVVVALVGRRLGAARDLPAAVAGASRAERAAPRSRAPAPAAPPDQGARSSTCPRTACGLRGGRARGAVRRRRGASRRGGIVEAQLEPAPAPLAARRSPRARRCARSTSSERGEAFVDLSREVAAAHPGGALNELLTVYSIVERASPTNLPGRAPPCRSSSTAARWTRWPATSTCAARSRESTLLIQATERPTPTSAHRAGRPAHCRADAR